MALVLAFVFHFYTGTFLETPLQIFAVVACLCLLSFVDDEKEPRKNQDDVRNATSDAILAGPFWVKAKNFLVLFAAFAYMLISIILPLRIYFLGKSSS